HTIHLFAAKPFFESASSGLCFYYSSWGIGKTRGTFLPVPDLRRDVGLVSVQLQVFALETELRNCYNLSKPTCARQAGVPPHHKSLAGA
ncbi:hypothetical protein, partial [Phocaeicola vulgatus]|uniref:hypothetical protein n=1 Tax=Phocaeicola vulgatus TaxID=821 RepID=UPI001C871A10